MEDTYSVQLTQYAKSQMIDTVRYISKTLLEPTTAHRWLDTMEKEILSLSLFPKRIPLTKLEPWHSQGIRQMIVKNHFVYFWIDDDRKEVWITAVVYSRRNQAEQLEEMPSQIF